VGLGRGTQAGQLETPLPGQDGAPRNGTQGGLGGPSECAEKAIERPRSGRVYSLCHVPPISG
jgi:hypothetical protein